MRSKLDGHGVEDKPKICKTFKLTSHSSNLGDDMRHYARSEPGPINMLIRQFLPVSCCDIELPPLSISDGIVFEPSNKVRNLGVIFDRQLSFRSYAGEVCKSVFSIFGV